MKRVSAYLGITSQAYYKKQKAEEYKQLSERVCLKLVSEVRKKLPKIGVRKLYHILGPSLEFLPYKISRDKMFKLLRDNDMLIKVKRRFTRTTYTDFNNPVYPNLIKDLKVTRPNQVLVSDITYIRHSFGFAYLSLVCDLYSRKILGFHVSNNLSATGSFNALRMAFEKIDSCDLKRMIHHSDRGCQYTSQPYTEYLKSYGCKISMSSKGNPYENAVMERINGILKEEFFLGNNFSDIQSIKKAVKQAVMLYNEERPHLSLAYKTPSCFYEKGAEKHVA